MTFTALPSQLDERAVVRVTGPQGIVAAIPPSLGFVPANSLVLACIQPPNGRIGPVVRADLPDADDIDLVTPLVKVAERCADEVAVICYHDGPRPACIDELVDALRARRIHIKSTVSVQGARIRDARSKSAMRRDPGIPLLGADDVQSVALRSAAILGGRVPLPSRGDLAASISPVPGRANSAMLRAIGTVRRALTADFQEAGKRLTPTLVRAVDEALSEAGAEYGEAGSITDSAAARLIALSTHVPCRDLIIARTVKENRVETVGLMSVIAAKCPEKYCAGFCSALAAAAYRYGDGARAHCALDRAIAAEPEHRMSHMLRSAIVGNLPPASLDILAEIPIPDVEDISPDAV